MTTYSAGTAGGEAGVGSSEEFKIYCEMNFIERVTLVPYRSQGNSAAVKRGENCKISY